MWRLEALTPSAVVGGAKAPGATAEMWRTLDTWAPRRDWRAAADDALSSLVDPLPSGTCLRVLSPKGIAGAVRVVAADGVPREVRARNYLDGDKMALASLRADPVAWWRGSTDGRHHLRLAAYLSPTGSPLRRQVVLAACACARLVLRYWRASYRNDTRPREAIEAAEWWSRGEATMGEVRDAVAYATGAFLDADCVALDAATCAAGAAVFAAGVATESRTKAAASAANAVDHASEAVAFAFDEDQGHKEKALGLCADLARRHIPLREVLVGLVAPAGGPR
jgi:hypothetical protein